MKKIIILGIIYIIIGYYFLQEGVYTNTDILQTNLVNLNKKIIDYNNNKYYVYVGITKDLEVAEKIIKIYEKEGYNITILEKGLSSEEFSTNVNQFDLLIKDTKDNNQILTIEEVVLANYEEIIKKQ